MSDRKGAYEAARSRLEGHEGEIADLSRLALQASSKSVEMYVHRLAYRHRGTDLGDALSAVDEMPPVSLREIEP